MEEAIKEALKAEKNEEVPIGCVIVDEDGKIIARAHNEKEEKEDVSAHAEILCLKKAAKKRANWRLNGCSIYVTLEPCLMCASAIFQARISKVVIAADEINTGAFGSRYDIRDLENADFEVIKGVLKEKAKGILVDFFKNRR